MAQSSSKKIQRHWRPIFCLLLLSPIVAEVLFGSTPLSRLANLLPMILFYGAGAIFIRELAVRWRLSWAGIIALALAFGVTEEAIALQTVFNPDYFGTDISYGREWGVNWVWSLFIIGYHSLWSIALPIGLTQLAFPRLAASPWFGRVGLAISGVLFVLMTVFFYFIFQAESGYQVPAAGFAAAFGIIASLVILAFLLPKRQPASKKLALPKPTTVGVAAFLGSAAWLGLFSLLFEDGRGLPAVALLLGGGVLIAAALRQSSRWAGLTTSVRHFHALLSGALIASTLFGFNVLMAENNAADLLAHGVFTALTLIGLAWVGRRATR